MRIDHLAFPSFDAGETYRFYTELMGFRLVDAFQGQGAEWGNRAFLHSVYAMDSGEVITFFDLDGMGRPPDDGLPKDIRHVALSVDTRAEIKGWKARLKASGVSYWEEDHGGVPSIYFSDPNGVMLEVTVRQASSAPAPARSTLTVVRRWAAKRKQRPVRTAARQKR